MSDELQQEPKGLGTHELACDDGAPTLRDPKRATPRPPTPPSRGVALSVLWWLEGNESVTDWTD